MTDAGSGRPPYLPILALPYWRIIGPFVEAAVIYCATKSGLLDLDRPPIRQAPGVTRGVSPMRRDGEEPDLLFLRHCQLGKPPVLLIDRHIPRACRPHQTSGGVLLIQLARGVV